MPTSADLLLSAASALRGTDPHHPKRKQRLYVAEQLEMQALVGLPEYDPVVTHLAQRLLEALQAP